MKLLFIFMSMLLAALPASAASVASLAERYQAGEPIRVLIVPGHDNEFSGSSGNGIREADINLRLASMIADDLARDPQISVTLTRDAVTGDYRSDLAHYFESHDDEVWDFIADAKKAFARKQKQLAREAGVDAVYEPVQVPHGDAKPTVAYRLYATNRWIDEKGFDLVIHVHFNDTYPRGGASGVYGGYSIYVPGKPLNNQALSGDIGNAIGARLRDIVPKSNLSLESMLANDSGVIPDTKLIALGSFDTLATSSVLIEYSYVYEPQAAPNFWDVTIPAFARATNLGLHDYLQGARGASSTFSYWWGEDAKPSATVATSPVMAIQIGLRSLGFYPPTGKTSSDCPMTGRYGPCTKSAVAAFQKKYYLGSDGVFGPATRAAMNGFFGR